MKVYQITDGDVEALRNLIARDPSRGTQLGGHFVLSEQERSANERAYRFFNEQICFWLESIGVK